MPYCWICDITCAGGRAGRSTNFTHPASTNACNFLTHSAAGPTMQRALCWRVPDIHATAKALAGNGVVFERYENSNQDALGIWMSPSGANGAWFKDPDGNVLFSLSSRRIWVQAIAPRHA